MAIILKAITKESVIILNKNPYLTYRDYTKFKETIKLCGFKCSLNKFIPDSILYLDEKCFKLLKDVKNPQIDASKFILIIDEHD